VELLPVFSHSFAQSFPVAIIQEDASPQPGHGGFRLIGLCRQSLIHQTVVDPPADRALISGGGTLR
jgi:hypothetical protein